MPFITHSPYGQLLRLHQPAAIGLLLWPCYWCLFLASKPFISLKLLLIFALGAFLMRSAGCIINDLWDKEIDAHIERTQSRPLAAKTLSVKNAIIILILLLLGAALLLPFLQMKTIFLGISVLGLIILYPLMKRVTHWPQLFLGMTFNWGVLMAGMEVEGNITLNSWLIYLASICWTLAYDTIYACQDRQGDQLLGMKSTALWFGNYVKEGVIGFYGIMALSLVGVGVYNKFSGMYFVGMIIIFGIILRELITLEVKEPAKSGSFFRRNNVFGLIVLGLISVERFL